MLSRLSLGRSLLGMLLLLWPALVPAQDSKQVTLLDVRGVIGPAAGDYVKRGLSKALEQHAPLVILRMDTPGGLDTSMREIIQGIIASPVPVVGYVAPSGARAASAGTYILYATHIAAMAPATNLGAATPIQLLGPSGGDEERKRPDKGEQDKSGEHGDTLSKKMVNDAVAYIRGLAELRGRNAEWAELAVREAVSLSAASALQQHVIDLIATNVPDLLAKLNGRKVNVLGQEKVLNTAGWTVRSVAPDWRTRFLGTITDPNVAFVLMMLGVYGLIYEFMNPGMVLPGVAGAISLLLALFAFQTLPIDYAGLALMLLGLAFLVGELFLPTFGSLGIGGVIAFVIGAVMLMDTDVPGYGISLSLIIAFALLSAAFILLIVRMALRARERPVVTGREQMIGGVGEVIDDFGAKGRIRIHGEVWEAQSDTPLTRGQQVRVRALEGLTLIVEPNPSAQTKEI